MREKNRNSIEIEKMLPQFTTMNVIDGQAGLMSYSSLIFYSLTIDNILNIVVLLILASITIGAVTGENGILRNANDAKEQTEIGEEKEIVDRATIQAMGNNKRGNIVEDELQEQLDKITGSGKTEADDVGEEFEVAFIESKRYYTVDKDGIVTGPQEIIDDKSPGDITKDENGDDIEEGQPYEIWCIEDLCVFSNEVNSGNSFRDKTVMLMRDLNFNSKYSYVNGNIAVDGNIPSCNSIEELRKELTENEGFYPIGDGKSNNSNFRGVFDGNKNAIKNIYINRPDMLVGLFGSTSNTSDYNIIIKNLSISGNMTGNNVGSIFANVSSNIGSFIKIENCISDVKIEGSDYVGGFIGINSASKTGNLIIANCINKGTINGKSYVGGILGYNYNSTKIVNCYNSGNISGDSNVGGIIGYDYRKSNIINSYNLGYIKSNSNAGGITGWLGWFERSIENCYNIGEISGSIKGGIIGELNISNELLTTKNCYYLNKNISKGTGSWNGGGESQEDINGVSDTEMKSSEILEKLNEYVTTNKEKEGIQLKKWIQGSDGYPTFE